MCFDAKGQEPSVLMLNVFVLLRVRLYERIITNEQFLSKFSLALGAFIAFHCVTLHRVHSR